MDYEPKTILYHTKRTIVDRISNPTYIPKVLYGYEEEVKTICEKLDEAIIRKKSISCLVNGPKLSGKSTLIRYCLSKYKDHDFITVEFSAITHFNDNLAFKEIAKALRIEVERGRSIEDTLELIRKSLGLEDPNIIQQAAKRKKVQPIIVIINELEEILKSSSKQSILYNILDLAHYRDASVSFIGTSSHHEIFDLFEKRIKSRFTQEMVLIPRLSYNNIVHIIISLLSLDSSVNLKENKFIEKWNTSILLAFQNENVNKALDRKYYQISTRLPDYHILILEILDLIDIKKQFITDEIILSAINNKDPIIKLLNTLTPFEFTILGCLSKIPNCQDEYITFNNLYNGEYKNFSESFYKTQDQAKAPSVIRAIERFQQLGIIKIRNRREIGEFSKFKISISLDSIKEAVAHNKSLPLSLVKYITEWLQ